MRNTSKIALAGIVLLSIASCKKGVNDKITNPPAYSEFGTSNLLGKYFITSAPGSSFKIPVGITNLSTSPRTIQLTYTSSTGAVAGTHYTAPTTITIPAGKALDSVEVKGIFANYPTGRKDSLKIKISGGDVPVNGYNNLYTLLLQKYCDVSMTALSGTYNNVRETTSTGGSPYGPYTVIIKNVQTLTPTTGSALIENLWDSGLDDIQILFDWTDPANFSVNIPMQYTGQDYDVGQPIFVRTSPGQPNSFSSCDQSVSLTVDFIVNNYPAPGSSAFYSKNYKINIKR
jgi:hypothetical protein